MPSSGTSAWRRSTRATRSSRRWPSFPSYVLDPLKLGGVPVRVPLARRADRPRRDARCDHAAHEARLHRRAEQPDRDDEQPRGARRVLRARPAARPDGARPGVLRVRRRSRLPRCDRRVLRRAGTACSSCARSRRSSASPGCGSATASGPTDVITAIGKVRRAFDVTSAGQEAALASLRGRGRDRAPPCR